MEITGKAHKFGDLINTDIHCSSKYCEPTLSQERVIQLLFYKIKPNFLEQVVEGDIIAGGRGFGTVSAREEAPALLFRIGIRAVLAKSFGYLFYRNAINVGLPVIECDTDMINDQDRLKLDLKKSTVNNLTSGASIPIKKHFSNVILRILEDGGLINHVLKHGCYTIHD